MAIIITASACSRPGSFVEKLMLDSGKFKDVLANAGKHRLQIIYTQIDRDDQNKPHLTSHKFRVNANEYFYPASTIKLPMAALALEKINDKKITGFTAFSDMEIDSAYSGQTAVKTDASSASGKPSIGHFIKKLFLVSDNDAFNRLYEFVGQREANERMIAKGFHDVRITHRLGILLSPEENRCTNPMRFYQDGKKVYEQDALCNDTEIKASMPILLGKGHIQGEELVEQPMDFRNKNAISLQTLHDVFVRIMFPENFVPAEKFNLTQADYQFLHEFMSKYPEESDIPDYGAEYNDDYCKFLMFGGTNQTIDRNIRIFNKIGLAYGFVIDMAYIIDFDKKIEFILGAVIYVNENEMLNDGVYEYESVGFPFMRDLGQLFYDYELNRTRAFVPDLSRFNWK